MTWLLHGARDQKDVKPFLPLLSGLIEIAIGIYEVTGAAPNHLAGALYRASLIFEAADWIEGAFVIIHESIAKWQKLVITQDSERNQQNLAGAKRQLEHLESRR